MLSVFASLIGVLALTTLHLAGCRTVTPNRDHRNTRGEITSPVAQEQDLKILKQVAQASSTILALIDHNLKINEQGSQSFRMQGPAKIPAGSVLTNPLDLLAALLEEIGIGRPSSTGGLSRVNWESLSGRRLMGKPVQIQMQSDATQRVLQVIVGHEPEKKVHEIARSQSSSWSDVTIALDQLNALYNEQVPSQRPLPNFQLTGALTLQMKEDSVLLLSQGMAWSSDRLILGISHLQILLQLPQSLMTSFELAGQLRGTDQDNKKSVTIHARKIEDHSLEFQIDYI